MTPNWVRSIFAPKAVRGSVRRRSALRVERLEPRDVPSTVTVSNGTLTYAAGAGIANAITVSVSGGNFSINDTGETIDASAVSGSAGSGTNTVTVPTTGVTAVNFGLADGANTVTSITGLTTTNLTVSSSDSLTLAGNITLTTGTVTLLANTDGVDSNGAGSDSLLQTAGTVTTTNTTAAAAAVTVNTAAGGTGNASINSITASSGKLTVNSNGGSVLYAGSTTLTAFQTGLQGNGGTAPSQVLKAGSYAFTATGTGSVGTTDRPIQTSAPATGTVFNLAAGSGGDYLVDWGSPIVLSGATATGAGNVRVVTANAGGHNLSVTGAVTTGSGSIYLAADDDFVLTAPIGGAGFSGTVYLAGNRDTGNTLNLQMNAGASITTSNTSATAVYLEGFNEPPAGSGTSTRAGGIILNNITTGDGGTVTATTDSGFNSAGGSQGLITDFNTSVVINAGPTGTIVLNAAPQTSGTSLIGTSAVPIKVAGGNVVAVSTYSTGTTGTNGSIYVTGTAATSFTASITGTGSNGGTINLATTAGPLTVAGPVNTINGGAVTLTGAGGVVLNAAVGSTTTGAVAVNGPLSGSGGIATGTGAVTVTQATDSTYGGVVSGSQSLVKAGAGTLTLTANQTNTGGATVSAGALASAPGGTASVAGPVAVAGTLTPGGGTAAGVFGTGNLSFTTGGTLAVNLNGSATPGTDYDQVAVTGTVNLTNSSLQLLVGANPSLAVGQTFTVLTNDGSDAVTGQFPGGTTIVATDNPSYQFAVNYAGGDGNDVVLTLTSVTPPRFLDVSGGSTVSYSTGAAVNSSLSVAVSGSNYVLTDTSGTIALSAAAIAAGWTGNNTTSVTGPNGSVTSLLINLGDGSDAVTGLNGAAAAVTVATTGTLVTSGTTTSTGSVTFSGSPALTLGGTLNPTGNLTTTGVGTLTLSGTVAPTGAANLSAVDIVRASGGLITAATVNLTGSDAVGTAAAPIPTQSAAITAAGGAGGVYVAEADGATVAATTTGAGAVSFTTATGTLTVGGAGVTTAAGNISLSSGDGITLLGSLTSTSGTVAITANTDGAGAQGFNQAGSTQGTTQTPASITTGNGTTGAVSITVNTAAGGTGDAVIGQGSVGSNSGGGYTVLSNGGNILWSNDSSYTAFGGAQTGQTNGGSNTQTLHAYQYTFRTGSGGTVGTAGRPLQTDNYGSNGANAVANLTATAGTGGVYVVDWDAAGTHDLTVGDVSAQGAGSIFVVTANAGGHNLYVIGTVTTGSGGVALYADDELYLNATALVGGAGFSGTVDLQGNRDQGNGQSITMVAGSAIATSNASTTAVSLVNMSGGGSGASTGSSDLTPQGGVVLTNVTVGDGGTITVNAAGGSGTSRQGSIVQRSGTLLDAGPTGSVVLLAAQVDTTGTLNGGNVGVGGTSTAPAPYPITVRAAKVTVTTNGTAVGNTGNVNVVDTVAGTFNATSTGSATSTMILATQAGTLTVGSVTTAGGGITLSGGGGTTAGGGVAAGSNGPVTVSGTLTVAAGTTFGPPGPVTVTGLTTVPAGTTLSPGGTAVGTITTGGLEAAGGTINADFTGTAAGQFDQIVVTAGAVDLANAALNLTTSASLNIGDSFVLVQNNTPNAVTGQFTAGTSVSSVNNPSQQFAVDYAGGDGNDVTVKLTSVATGSVVNLAGGTLSFAAGAGQDNNLTVGLSNGTYTLTDAFPITLTSQAAAAGWAGSGTTTITGPASAVSSLLLATGDGVDTVTLNGLANPFTVQGGGQAGDTVAVNGTLSFTGNATIAGVDTVSGSGSIVSPAGTLTVAAAVGIGSSFSPLLTRVAAAVLSAGDGGVNLTEADGLNLTATVTGAGGLNVVNTAGTLTVAGATSVAAGGVTLSSGDDIVVAADLNGGAGDVTLAANTDGAGTQGVSQTGGLISTASNDQSAVTITANTFSGGTGNVVIDNVTAGTTGTGGLLTVTSNAGSILYAGTAALTASQQGTTNGGAAPTRVLTANSFLFTAFGGGSVGTAARPLQTVNLGTDSTATVPNIQTSNYYLGAGDGGAYVVKWGPVDSTLTGATATGAGNILFVNANASGDNLFVTGSVSAAAGSIYLGSDDNLVVGDPMGSSVVIGGPNFSGTVTMQANRDQGTAGQPLSFTALDSIQTSNATANAVYLDISGDVGTPSLLTISNVTVGNGGTITVNATPNGAANETGQIIANPGTALNAGANGHVVLVSSLTGTTFGDATGSAASPVNVTAGTVSYATGNGNVYLVGSAGQAVSGTTTGNGQLQLGAAAGAVVVPTGTAVGLPGAGSTSPPVVPAGSVTVTRGTVQVDGTLSTVGGTAVADGATLSGTGTVAGPVAVQGTVSPGDNGAGVLASGDLSFGSSGARGLAIDLLGVNVGTGYDQMAVTGAVNLTGANLVVNTGSFTVPAGSQFVIVSNDGTDPVTGTFAGLPEGATVAVGSQSFRVTYVGGDGNDVVLLAPAPVPVAPTVLVNGSQAPSATVTASLVKSLSLTFNTTVTVSAGAFSLTNGTTTLTSNANGGVLVSVNGAVATLTFDPSVTGVNYGSLSDGSWTLTTNLALVQNRDGVAGSGTATAANIRRLYGDVNGDGAVNGTDLPRFRAAFGTNAGDANYLAALDFNGDGTINGTELAQFRGRFGSTLP